MKNTEVIIKVLNLGQSGWFLQELWTEDNHVGREMDHFDTFKGAYGEACRWEADLRHYGVSVMVQSDVDDMPSGRKSQIRAGVAKKYAMVKPKGKKKRKTKKVMTEEEVATMMEQSLKDGSRWRGRLW